MLGRCVVTIHRLWVPRRGNTDMWLPFIECLQSLATICILRLFKISFFFATNVFFQFLFCHICFLKFLVLCKLYFVVEYRARVQKMIQPSSEQYTVTYTLLYNESLYSNLLTDICNVYVYV